MKTYLIQYTVLCIKLSHIVKLNFVGGFPFIEDGEMQFFIVLDLVAAKSSCDQSMQ